MFCVPLYVLCAVALFNNHLDGTIPGGIGSLLKLNQIGFQNNGLTGTVPSSFTNLTNLEGLWLHNNKLSGSLPDVFDTMSSLDWLVISNNTFSGSLPDSLGNISSFSIVDVSNNPFTGSIPTSICNLNGTTMDIQRTKINGTVPEECCSSLDIKRDNSWFMQKALQCSCCGDAAECFLWRTDNVMEDVMTHPPCPTNNIYSLDYYWQYEIDDMIIDQEVSHEDTFEFHNAQFCLSPTGCNKIFRYFNSNFESPIGEHSQTHKEKGSNNSMKEQILGAICL